MHIQALPVLLPQLAKSFWPGVTLAAKRLGQHLVTAPHWTSPFTLKPPNGHSPLLLLQEQALTMGLDSPLGIHGQRHA